MLDTNPLIQQTNGKFIEVAGKTLYQCTDEANYWLRMLGKPLIIGRNAIDFKTAPGYTYVPNTASFLPQEGDLAIFGLGQYGDVAVVTKGTTLKDLVVIGQNFPLKSACRIRTHRNYAAVDGFLVLSSASQAKYYIVKPGDSLSRIAKSFATTVDALLKLNPFITNPSLIRVGWKLRVK